MDMRLLQSLHLISLIMQPLCSANNLVLRCPLHVHHPRHLHRQHSTQRLPATSRSSNKNEKAVGR